MVEIRATLDSEKYQKRLKRMQTSVSPQNLRRIFRRIGIQMLTFIDRDYKERSQSSDETWRPVSPWAWLLRPKGSGGRVGSWAKARQRASQAPKLINRGILRASFSPNIGGKNKVFKISSASVEVGSSDSRAKAHQDGGQGTFPDFNQIASRVRNKTKGAFTEQALRFFKQREGKPFNVPKREIISEFSKTRRLTLTNILREGTFGSVD